jgi:hypothetical protein
MKNWRWTRAIVALSYLGVMGCGHGHGTSAAAGSGNSGAASGGGQGPGGTSSIPAEPPKPDESTDACIISADCPAGTHCDLGECAQECSSKHPCAKGLACSVRARCVKPEELDADPPPVTEHAGTVTAEASKLALEERDTEFELQLESDTDALVGYRVEVKAPFLKLEGDERGEFAGGTRLKFSVAPSGISGPKSAGVVIVHTTLGDVAVNPSLRVGLTGRYQGVMRYNAGKTPLGDVGVAFDMLDKNGNVRVRVDPARSMTFPAAAGGAVTGRGAFTFTDGLALTLAQVVDPSFGGERNHFKRPIGRRISFALKPTGSGKLEGTFEEKIYGVTQAPLSLNGTAYLEPSQQAEPEDFMIGATPVMPAAQQNTFPDVSAFSGWNDYDCFSDCQYASDRLGCISGTIEPIYYQHLVDSLTGGRTSSEPLDDLAKACESELALTTTSDYRNLGYPRCASIPPLACSLQRLATGSWTTAGLPLARTAFNRVTARMLAPALFVAQNSLAVGLKRSFLEGAAAQGESFVAARSALRAPATFAFSSGLLGYLKTLPAAVAKGDDDSKDPTQTNYPSARALARLVYVLQTLDGEESRADAIDVTGELADKLERAQSRGLLGFFEAATLASVMDAWDNPANIGGEFVGSLTLSDRGFASLQQGATLFGVPEGQVPLVYDPARPQPSNFEQVLEVRAKPALDQFQADQAAFEAAHRDFEQNASRLTDETESVRRTYEDQISAICGSRFDVDSVKTDEDWETCGADGSGEFSELSLDIAQAYLRLQASQSRIRGLKQKYAIDEKRLAAAQQVRVDQMQFIDEQGTKLQGLALAEGYINVAEKTIDVAANTQLFNAGAPVAMAAVTAVMETMRTGITLARQGLETAQQLRSAADENQLELLAGMAELQKQLIDIAQLELEMEQDTLAITQADLRRRNTVDRARRLADERLRSLARISESPITDPTFRILQTQLALQAVMSRTAAQRWLYRAGRALEYEINTSLGGALPQAVLGAYNSSQAERLARCLTGIFNDYSAEFGVAQEFTTTVSVREMLGFTAPRQDNVTGETLSEGELFRQWILRNENVDTQGSVTVSFSTNLQPGNDLWSSNVCDDKVANVQAQLVGDFQGDNEAEIQIGLEGSSILRRCDSDELINWSIDSSAEAVIQAGVNSFGEGKPNGSLFGQSVARATWKVVIPAGSVAPANSDLDLKALDDIVLKVTHRALPRRNKSLPVSFACLGSVGAGG